MALQELNYARPDEIEQYMKGTFSDADMRAKYGNLVTQAANIDAYNKGYATDTNLLRSTTGSTSGNQGMQPTNTTVTTNAQTAPVQGSTKQVNAPVSDTTSSAPTGTAEQPAWMKEFNENMKKYTEMMNLNAAAKKKNGTAGDTGTTAGTEDITGTDVTQSLPDQSGGTKAGNVTNFSEFDKILSGGTSGTSSGVPGAGTLPPMFANLLSVGAGQLAGETGAASDNFQAAENARRVKLASELALTKSGQAMIAAGVPLSSLTIDQLNKIISDQGIQLSDKTLDQIKANGQSNINNLSYAQTFQLAQIDTLKNQNERNLNRALTDVESENTVNANMLARQMGMMGGGKVSSVASNMAYIENIQKGNRNLDDIRAKYFDQSSSLASSAKYITDTYTNNVNTIQNQMATDIQNKLAEVTSAVDDLIGQGVKNKVDLNAAIIKSKADYLKFYSDTITKGAEYVQKENQQLFEQQKWLDQQQQAIDKNLTDNTDQIYLNGKPVMDKSYAKEYLAQIPQLLGMGLTRDASGKIVSLTPEQQSAIIAFKKAQNPSFSTFGTAETGFFALDHNSGEFKQLTGPTSNPQELGKLFVDLKAAVDAGMDPEQANNIYTQAVGARSRAGVQESVVSAVSGVTDGSVGGQCGAFVNNILGKPGLFKNTIQEKIDVMKKSYSSVPVPGSIMVMDLGAKDPKTGQNYGHVAIVNGVNEDGTISVTDSNWDKKETIRTDGKFSINDPRIKGYYVPNGQKIPGSNPFVTENQITAADKEFAKTLDPVYADMWLKKTQADRDGIKSIADYSMDIDEIYSKRYSKDAKTIRPEVMALVKKVNPTWTEAQYGARKAFAKEWASLAKGKPGDRIVSFNAALQHMTDALYSYQKMKDSGIDIRVANQVANYINSNLNDPAIARFKAEQASIAGEVAIAVANGYKPSVEQDADAVASLDPAQGYDSLVASLQGKATFIQRNMYSTVEWYNDNMEQYPKKSILQPKTVEAIRFLGLDPTEFDPSYKENIKFNNQPDPIMATGRALFTGKVRIQRSDGQAYDISISDVPAAMREDPKLKILFQ